MKHTYEQIADNLAGDIRADWVEQIRLGDRLAEALREVYEWYSKEAPNSSAWERAHVILAELEAIQ